MFAKIALVGDWQIFSRNRSIGSLLHAVARTSLADNKSVGMFRKAPIGQNSSTHRRYFSRIVWLEARQFSSVCSNIIR
jgi:hypothetical protein